jgi:hypothetical protein
MHMLRIKAAFLLLALVLLGGCGDSQPTPSPTSAPTSVDTSATTPAVGWQEYASTEGRFTIRMPGKPIEETLVQETEAGDQIESTVARLEADSVTYMVIYTDLPQASLELGEDEFFRQYIEGVIQNVESQSGVKLDKPQEQKITLDGNPGRDFTYSAQGQGSRTRTYLVGSRHYQTIAAGPMDKLSGDQTTAFLDSFKLTP